MSDPEPNLPVPRKSREDNSTPPMVKGELMNKIPLSRSERPSSALTRLNHQHPIALLQRSVYPACTRPHCAVDGHGQALPASERHLFKQSQHSGAALHGASRIVDVHDHGLGILHTWEPFPRPNQPSGPSSLRSGGETCFPYGGATRIRFEGFRNGSCPNLSPEPRARLNEVRTNRTQRGVIFNPKVRLEQNRTGVPSPGCCWRAQSPRTA